MKKLLITLAMVASASVTAMAGTNTPSFNCSNVKLPTEILICADAGLSGLDVQNASVFYALRDKLPQNLRKAFNTDTRKWLKTRNECGLDEVCIRSAYNESMMKMCKLADNFGFAQELGLGLEECQNGLEEGGQCDGEPGECD